MFSRESCFLWLAFSHCDPKQGFSFSFPIFCELKERGRLICLQAKNWNSKFALFNARDCHSESFRVPDCTSTS